jgi:hypothetical protein
LTTWLLGEHAGLVTAIENVAVEVPIELVAVMVIDREARVDVGVPESSPVAELKLTPAAAIVVESTDGIEYEATGPPELEIA